MTDVLPRCRGCGAAVGEQHDRICDVARCRATGLQWQRCGHQQSAPVAHEPDRWTGRWPATDDCIRLGWFARFENGGWVRCDHDTAGAQPDINRLYAEAEWDPVAGRWAPRVGESR